MLHVFELLEKQVAIDHFLCHYLSAMVKVGDNHWYGKSVPQNITFAAEMYAEAASKNDLPQVTLVSSRKNIRRLSEFSTNHRFQSIRDLNEHSRVYNKLLRRADTRRELNVA